MCNKNLDLEIVIKTRLDFRGLLLCKNSTCNFTTIQQKAVEQIAKKYFTASLYACVLKSQSLCTSFIVELLLLKLRTQFIPSFNRFSMHPCP